MPDFPDDEPSTPQRNRVSNWISSHPVSFKKVHFGPAFWTVASVLSLVMNLALIVILLLLLRYIFVAKQFAANQLVGGLYSNFVKMDDAHILSTIQVQDSILVSDTIKVVDTIPVVFDLPLKQNTKVILVQDTPIRNTTIILNGSEVPLDIILPKGTPLNIALNLKVPVNQQVPVTLNVPVHLKVPVNLSVPVDIPLNQTQLHEPFVGLREVVSPIDHFLNQLPNRPDQIPFCSKSAGWLCRLIFVDR